MRCRPSLRINGLTSSGPHLPGDVEEVEGADRLGRRIGPRKQDEYGVEPEQGR